MRFIVFSDIHYADYTSGVTLADIALVERTITMDGLSTGASFCIFCGDRYLAHEPQDYVRIVSDAEQKYRNDMGLVTFSLVGNHDLYAKAPVSGHSNRHLQTVWNASLPNIVVMDEVRTYRHPRVPGVAVHAIPACFDWTPELLDAFDFQPGELSLLAFHDMLEGAMIDHRSSYLSPKGKKLCLIDDPRFRMVFGGDVHLPQKLPFQSTRGGYVGACIQQSRRDRGNPRGWLSVDATSDVLSVESVDSPCPVFVDATFDSLPTAEQVATQVVGTYGVTTENNIVDVILTGSRESLDGIPSDWSIRMQAELRAKRVNVLKRATMQTAAPRVTSKASQTAPLEDLQAYLSSGRAPLDGHDPDRLLAKAAPILARLGGDDV